MTSKPLKSKKCKAASCGKEFMPFRPLQKVCSPLCAAEIVRIARMKQERKETRANLQELKPLKKWLDEAQAAINRWVREVRDEGQPCISCGRHANSYDAGHFRSRGAASHLRFNEDNIHRQCSRPCNHDLSGNILNFRKGLINKIGVERVEALENDNSSKRWTIEEAKAIKDKYNKLYNDHMKKRKDAA